MGPILYSVYTNDMPKSPSAHLALFADDTAVFASHPNPNYIVPNVQRHLDKITQWCNLWKIKINSTKYHGIMFTTRRRPPDRQLTIEGRDLPWCDTVKYLGLKIDKKNSPAMLTLLMQVIGVRAAAFNYTTKLKLRIWKLVVLPKILYGCEIFGTAADTHVNKLQVVQNKALRIITDAPWFVRNSDIHRDTKTPHISTIIKTRTQVIYTTAGNSPHNLIATLGTDPFHVNYKRPRNRITRQYRV